MLLRLCAAALAAATLTACATNPATGRREITLMSEGQEIALGKESDTQVRQEMGLYDDPELQRYVSGIGLRLAKLSERPNLPWQFAVVDQAAVNAFALPGGFIYVTRGILPYLDSEAELAGVLGHEIGHVTARHAAQQYTRQIGGTVGLIALGVFVPAAQPFSQASQQAMGLLFLKYGRDDELQADSLGVRYASLGKWDPEGVPSMLTTLGRLDEAAGDRKGVPNFLSTHPEPLARVKEIGPEVQKAKAGKSGFVTDREAIRAQIDGVIFGDNPAQGVVRGTTFLHPPLRFRLDFPTGWQVANSPQQVVSKAPNADVFEILQLVPQPQGSSVEEIGVANMQKAGFRLVRGERATIAGLDAHVGEYEGMIEGLGDIRSRATHLRHGDNVYMIAGLAAPTLFTQYDAAFGTSQRSFRPISASEAEAIKPSRIALHTVRSGDTWQSLAGRSAGAVTPAALAAMNHAEAGAQPQAGTQIKVVVAG
ncbi:MAG TPA: M48 family metalloprotease [Vicinamibacterales bacterium]|jgi:predicted Zn-dependent protease|nr:M48 family metalloprotease [Vicinamibacterales bacterium]